MLGAQVTYKGVREGLLGAIRHRLAQDQATHLSARGAVRLLDWAEACVEGREKADLLALFAAAGGLEVIRDSHGPLH